MKKILILLLCLLAINISGCSKKDNNDNENTNQINEATYINYLEKDSNFFNTAFSKDEEENLYSAIKNFIISPERLSYYKKKAIQRGKFFSMKNTVSAVEKLVNGDL